MGEHHVLLKVTEDGFVTGVGPREKTHDLARMMRCADACEGIKNPEALKEFIRAAKDLDTTLDCVPVENRNEPASLAGYIGLFRVALSNLGA